jgi:hypothetical protein
MRALILGVMATAFLQGGVTLDNWQTGANNSGSGAATWTHTNRCSTNCMGYVLVSSISSTVAMTATWGGNAMTLVTSHGRTHGANGAGTFYIYCIATPPSGTQTVSVTPASGWALTTSVTLSGAKQSCSADATGFQESASSCPFNSNSNQYECPVAITPSASNVYVFGIFSQSGSNLGATPTSTGVLRTISNQYGDHYVYDSGGTVTGSFTLNAGGSSGTTAYSGLVMSVAPPGATATVVANPTAIVVGPQ